MIEYLPALLSLAAVFVWGVVSLLMPKKSRVRIAFLEFGWMGHLITLGGVLATFFMATGLFERGWILPKAEELALKISFGVDQPTVGVLVAITLFSMLAWFSVFKTEDSRENGHIPTGAWISQLGAVFTWISQTLWMQIAGLFMVAIGGLVVQLGNQKIAKSGESSEVAARVFWLRMMGIFSFWIGGVAFEHLGAVLIMLGVAFFSQLLPFSKTQMKWIEQWEDENQKASDRFAQFVIGVVIPGISVFGVLLRQEQQLFHEHELTGLSFALLGIGFLQGLHGVLQSHTYKRLVSFWISGLAFGFTIYLNVGGPASVAWVLAQGYSAVLWCATSHFLTGFIGRYVRVISMLSASGLPGFLALGAAQVWFETLGGLGGSRGGFDIHQAYPFVIPAGIALFVHGFLSIRLALLPVKVTQTMDWRFLVATVVFMGSLAVIWSGQLSGGFFGQDVDRFFEAMIAVRANDGPSDVLVMQILGAIIVVSWAIGIWVTAKSKKNTVLKGPLEGIRVALEQGLYIEWVFEKFFGFRFWDKLHFAFYEWKSLDRLIQPIQRIGQMLGDGWFKVEATGLGSVGSAVSKGIEVPSKLMRVIQSGDLQWYLLFGIGGGLILLLHFIQ